MGDEKAQKHDDREFYDFTGRKMVFVDWIYIYAGYGSRLKGRPDPTDTEDHMPYGIELKAFSPLRDTEPVIKPEYPWEFGYMGGYSTVIEDEGVLKLYYEVFHQKNLNKWSDLDTYLYLATSKDGVHWDRPSLGIVEFNGSKDNNILVTPEMNPVGSGIHGAHVFKDPNGSDEQRYKMNYCGPRGGTYGAYSSDGIHWKFVTEPIADTEADSQNIIYWDDKKGKYIGYFRSWYNGRRGIVRAESDDFWHWPPFDEFDLIFISDPALPPDVDYYTNAFHPWPGTGAEDRYADAFLMFPSMYHRTGDYLNTEMFVSRTGKQWFRPPGSVINMPNYRNIHPEGSIYYGKGVWKAPEASEGDKGFWNILFAHYPRNHNDPVPKGNFGGLFRARFREDGFMGIQTIDSGIGEFWTSKFVTRSPKIYINAVTGHQGYIRIGLEDTLTLREIDEFEIGKSKVLNGDLLWEPLGWMGDDGEIFDDLSDYDDVLFRMHIKMKNATIFAFKFGE